MANLKQLEGRSPIEAQVYKTGTLVKFLKNLRNRLVIIQKNKERHIRKTTFLRNNKLVIILKIGIFTEGF